MLYHELTPEERKKRVWIKRIINFTFSIIVYVLFFTETYKPYMYSELGVLWIEIELVAIIVEPFFFELFFPWLAKSSLELAEGSQNKKLADLKDSLNESILTKFK